MKFRPAAINCGKTITKNDCVHGEVGTTGLHGYPDYQPWVRQWTSTFESQSKGLTIPVRMIPFCAYLGRSIIWAAGAALLTGDLRKIAEKVATELKVRF